MLPAAPSVSGAVAAVAAASAIFRGICRKRFAFGGNPGYVVPTPTEGELAMTDRELEYYLELTDPAELQKLYDAAYQVKLQHVGALVSLRGLVEISNICSKNCYYCGIRRGNAKVERYSIDRAEIVQAAVWAHRQHYGSICLQAGEIASEKFTAFIEDTLREIGEKTGDGLGITLSLGEQSEETYRRWREAGARR